MKIRRYQAGDGKGTYDLFYETVQRINCQDYSPEQLAVWAKPVGNQEDWHQSLAKNYAVVAERNHQLVGFADITEGGYLDRFYVHHLYQGQGIAKRLVAELEKWASQQGVTEITVAASITAKPFFLKNGYCQVSQQQVEREGQLLTNYLMKKPVNRKETKQTPST